MEIAKLFLEYENLPFINIDEALEFAEITTASNKESLLYIINLPTTEKGDCRALEIRPIKRRTYK